MGKQLVTTWKKKMDPQYKELGIQCQKRCGGGEGGKGWWPPLLLMEGKHTGSTHNTPPTAATGKTQVLRYSQPPTEAMTMLVFATEAGIYSCSSSSSTINRHHGSPFFPSSLKLVQPR